MEELHIRVAGKAATTELDCGGRNIDADVLGVARQRQLAPVAAAELDHPLDVMLLDEIIEHARLEISETSSGTRA